MKKITTLVLLCLFMSSCQSNGQDSDETGNLIQKRNEFAEIAKKNTDAIDANWQSSTLLVLTVKQDSLKESVDSGIKKDKNEEFKVNEAFTIARDQATLGRDITGKLTCVKILYEDGQKVGAYCAVEE